VPAVAPFDVTKAKQHQEAWSKRLGVPVEIANSIGMKLVLIPPGEFVMGSPKELIEEELNVPGIDAWERGPLPGEGPQHRVRITRPFYLGMYKVTQEEYQRVMSVNPSTFSATGDHKDKVAGQDTKRLPVENVSWDDAGEFCRKLSEMPGEKAAGRTYQLPSEAQWEYACRAGSAGRFSFSSGRSGIPRESEEKELSDYAWFKDNAGEMTHTVGGKRPGAWGLFDMHGNVWEWCQDWYDQDYYAKSPADDPMGPLGGSGRVRRGGCCIHSSSCCQSAYRKGDDPGARRHNLGFRALLVLADTAAERAKSIADVPNAAPVSKPPGPNGEKAPLKKLDPPSPDEQKRLIREIDEVYKLGEAKDQVAKTALARKLLESGRKTMADRAEQFVLLRRAGETACDAGEADLMAEAVDAIAAAGFNIQPIQVKLRLWKRLLEQGSSGGAHQISTVSASCVRFAEGAAASGAVDEASEVLDAARNAAAESKKRAQTTLRTARLAMARTRNPADKAAWEKKATEAQAELEEIETALGALTDSAKRLQQARRDHEAFQTARQRLKTAPDDPDACLAVGRWSCFYEGDWDGGLKLLARGSDDALKSLAAEELASKPTKAEARLARADAWWDLAEKAAGMAKSAMRRRAAHWYQQAMPDLAPGLGKSKVEERLAQADEELLPEADSGSARVRPPLAVAPFSEKTAKIFQARWAKYLCVPVVQTNSISMKLVLIPPGEFMMGSSKELIEEESKAHGDNDCYKYHLPFESPQHRVRITRPFYLGMYEVTQAEYWRVMGANPSRFSATGDLKDRVAGSDTRRFPVENVLWPDAAEFCRKLSQMPEEKAAGRWYRLPSEAQWEHACRAGSTGRYSFSPRLQPISREDDEKALSDYGWFDGNSGGMTHCVGGRRASAWGLYDMHGNVEEWCEDWRSEGYYAKSVTDDPAGPLEGVLRVLRGGGCGDPAAFCRSAHRFDLQCGGRVYFTGFRVSVVLADDAAERATTSPAGDAAQPSGDSTADKPSPAVASPDSQPLVRLPAVGRLIGADGKWKLPPGAPAPAVAPFDAAKAKAHQEGWAKQLGVPVEIASSIGMTLALIPPGEFTMGSPKGLIEEEWNAHRADQWYADRLPGEGPQHQVRITKPFFLGRYEVTQEEYQRVVGANPSEFSATGNHRSLVGGQDTKRFPVENVSWDEAAEFCRKLSEIPGEKAAGRTYRLPSDAQWEYACRAGSTGRFSFSPRLQPISKEDDEKALSDYGWFSGNSGEMTHAVGGKRPSAWGLYDMYGNVWEWCQDWYDNGYYASSATDDPAGPPVGSVRAHRGGAWDHTAGYCRSADHGSNPPGLRHPAVGFRVSLVLPDK
jgi:formylglycine-generating enzyme required for sulfatase activity